MQDKEVFFLCWGSGSCNDGSCCGNNVEEISSLETVNAKIEILKEKLPDGSIRLILGKSVMSVDW